MPAVGKDGNDSTKNALWYTLKRVYLQYLLSTVLTTESKCNVNKHLPTTIPAYKITATIKIKCTEILASIKYWFGDIF